jgi:hypothetical protein
LGNLRKPVDDVFNVAEVNMDITLMVSDGQAGGVIRPWHVKREVSGTWEALIVPIHFMMIWIGKKRDHMGAILMAVRESDQLIVL